MKVAIIQARTGSTRLPGKVLKRLGDLTVIQQVYDRVKQAKQLDRVVVAIPDLSEDDALAQHVGQFCDYITRGSEEDVLGRYMKAANENGASTIIRVTSDCPFFDAEILDLMLEEFADQSSDYMTNTLDPYLPRGLDAEVFTIDALRSSFEEANEPHQREHVTPFIYQNPERFSISGFRHLTTNYSDLRWTLDTGADWALIEKMYGLLDIPFHSARLEHFLGLYHHNPGLRMVNASIVQKSLKD